MSHLLCWFDEISSAAERYLWGAVLIALAFTLAGQAALTTATGRRLLNPVESLEGIPWPPQEDAGACSKSGPGEGNQIPGRVAKTGGIENGQGDQGGHNHAGQ